MADNRNTTGGNSPSLVAFHVPNRRNAAWIRIGAAWPHKDGEGYRLRIELLPLDVMTSGELSIQLRTPDPGSRHRTGAKAGFAARTGNRSTRRGRRLTVAAVAAAA